MNIEPIRYVPIWSGWLRAAHWLIAGGVLFTLFSAWALEQGPADRVLDLQPGTLHAVLGKALALFSLVHVIAAALHDWKGEGALVSAMFSGKRYFHVNRQQQIESRMLNTGIPVDITPGKPAAKTPQQN